MNVEGVVILCKEPGPGEYPMAYIWTTGLKTALQIVPLTDSSHPDQTSKYSHIVSLKRTPTVSAAVFG